ncbi:MAG: DNA repair protein RecN [Phascolarctobacterium sp.]|nr:DNA repair protein RecN [Phascolarctobacterium sp.]
MLQSLHVHNFALLEDARVEFVPGFNVFTGETGAGKSILIDAFSLVLGGRGSAEFVRHGTEGLWVQAVFELNDLPEVNAFLEAQGIECEEELFLKRQINAAGKGRAFVNGQQVPLSVLKELGSLLVDIHGQHENQALLKAEAPRKLVDLYGGIATQKALADYQELYKEYVALGKKLNELKQSNEQQDLLLDRYAWEIQEIQNAKLVVGEEDSLEAEARVLQHSEKIISCASGAHGLLDADKGVLSLLARAKDTLQGALRYDERLQSVYDNLDSSWITLEDCRQELSDYLANSDFNGQRAVEVQDRLDIIYRLQKKYGGSTEAVLTYLAATLEKYKALQNIAEAIAKAEAALDKARKQLMAAGIKLSEARAVAAEALGQAITKHIQDLAMPNGSFVIQKEKAMKFTPHGIDELQFMFSANMGEPLALLEKVASGGELSRIALALKTVLMHAESVPTMVFDEIDTGVGGLTAQKMAEKIAIISKLGQVLCITHLPQIAAYADRHIYIEKQSLDGRTKTELQVLSEEARINELVRMGGGDINSEAARANATELLRRRK